MLVQKRENHQEKIKHVGNLPRLSPAKTTNWWMTRFSKMKYTSSVLFARQNIVDTKLLFSSSYTAQVTLLAHFLNQSLGSLVVELFTCRLNRSFWVQLDNVFKAHNTTYCVGPFYHPTTINERLWTVNIMLSRNISFFLFVVLVVVVVVVATAVDVVVGIKTFFCPSPLHHRPQSLLCYCLVLLP